MNLKPLAVPPLCGLQQQQLWFIRWASTKVTRGMRILKWLPDSQAKNGLSFFGFSGPNKISSPDIFTVPITFFVYKKALRSD